MPEAFNLFTGMQKNLLSSKTLWILFFCIILAIFLCSPISAKQEKPEKLKSESEKPVFVSPIQYFNQNEKGPTSWCVVYSTAMLLSRYGIREKPADIASGLEMPDHQSAYFSWKSTFSNPGSVERYLQEEHNFITRKKIFVTLRDYLVDWIKKNIDNNRPVLVIYGKWGGHAVVLVGYDDKFVYMNDPSGAYFYQASLTLGKKVLPRYRPEIRRQGMHKYEAAGTTWEDFEEFMKENNLWGHMITVNGRKEASKLPDSKRGESPGGQTEKPPKDKDNNEQQENKTPEQSPPQKPKIFGPNIPADYYDVIFE